MSRLSALVILGCCLVGAISSVVKPPTVRGYDDVDDEVPRVDSKTYNTVPVPVPAAAAAVVPAPHAVAVGARLVYHGYYAGLCCPLPFSNHVMRPLGSCLS